MKSNKNQTPQNEANVSFATNSMNRVPQEMPVKESDDATPFREYGQKKEMIVRRFSFDNNGGGYAGL